MFHDVTIATYDGSEPLPDQIMLERQIGLLGSTTLPWVHALKEPELTLTLTRDGLTIDMGNVARKETFTIDFDQVAMKEWHDYVMESLNVISDKLPSEIENFLSTSFIDADTEKLKETEVALARKIGVAVFESSGLRIGEGPDDHASVKIFSKLAHAVLGYAPSIHQRYEANTPVEDDQPTASNPDGPSFHHM